MLRLGVSGFQLLERRHQCFRYIPATVDAEAPWNLLSWKLFLQNWSFRYCTHARLPSINHLSDLQGTPLTKAMKSRRRTI